MLEAIQSKNTFLSMKDETKILLFCIKCWERETEKQRDKCGKETTSPIHHCLFIFICYESIFSSISIQVLFLHLLITYYANYVDMVLELI